MNKIFVGIASYSDNMLSHTIMDAMLKADNPSGLTFGIVEQSPRDARLRARGENIRYVGLDPADARGVCWARAITMTLYNGEDYYLQIDSHMLFDKGWDTDLIRRLNACPSKKPIISCYPNAFYMVNNTPVRKPVTKGALCNVISKDFAPDHDVLNYHAAAVNAECVPGFSVAGGFMFTLGSFAHEVPYDPLLYFHGEEQALALRAYTRGWDMFHTPVPVYHLYDTDPNNHYRNKHWSKEDDAARTLRWWEFDKIAKERLVSLTKGNDHGVYGLGTVRSLDDFIEWSGIDFKNRIIHDKAKKPKDPIPKEPTT